MGELHRRRGLLVLVAVAANLGAAALASDGKVPAAVAQLLPKTAVLKGQDWGVLKTEFGKTFGGGMRAEFPQLPSTCDFTVGPELRVTIKGDTAWEAPPMLDMAIQHQAGEIAHMARSLPVTVKNMLATNKSVTSIGKLQDETLPGTRLLYIEFAETCARRNGPATVLRGFSRKGATQFYVELLLTRPAPEARAMALDMLNGFQKLDMAALAR